MIRAGQRLHEQRLAKGLTLEEVARGTKIRPEFLSAIENGEYQKLPSSTYAQGFISNYAEYLGLPKRELLALFRREFDAKLSYQVLPEGLTKTQEFPLRRFKLTGQVMAIFFAFLALVSYIGFQYRAALFNPTVSITAPAENAKIKGTTVIVEGKVSSENTVYINDEAVSVRQDGKFSKRIDVFAGNETVKIKVVNQFGKQTFVERHIVVAP